MAARDSPGARADHEAGVAAVALAEDDLAGLVVARHGDLHQLGALRLSKVREQRYPREQTRGVLPITHARMMSEQRRFATAAAQRAAGQRGESAEQCEREQQAQAPSP